MPYDSVYPFALFISVHILYAPTNLSHVVNFYLELRDEYVHLLEVYKHRSVSEFQVWTLDLNLNELCKASSSWRDVHYI
jgi:hypothetical protein